MTDTLLQDTKNTTSTGNTENTGVTVPEKFRDPETGEVRLDALIRSYLEMEKKLSTMLPSPESEDGRNRLLKELGRPDSAENYDIDLSHGLLERDIECDECMHEKGFTNDQAQLVYDMAAKKMVPLIVDMASEFEADREMERLVEKFGGPEKWREVSRQLLAFGRKNLPEDVLNGLASSYEGVMALHKMMKSEGPGIEAKTDGSALQGEEDLQAMIRDPKYWREKDPAFIRKVSEGFKKIYGQQ